MIKLKLNLYNNYYIKKMKTMKKTLYGLADGFRYFDRYPRLITFTYNKKEEFKTLIGGTISIATFIVLILYAYVVGRTLIEK